MSNVQKIQDVSIPKVTALDSVVPAWKLVLKRELTDLWVSGKAFNLLLLYSVLLGIMSYTYSFNAELSMVPPREAVFELLKNSMAFSVFIGLIIGADGISGERDRSTLESLLLTPVNRRHIIIAKLLAGISPWPAAYLIALPFLYLLAQGESVLGPAMSWGAITGTLLVLGYTGFGMLVSFWSSSNKVSYFVSLSIYALHLVPVELTGDGADITGEVLQWINPISSANYFLSKHLLYSRSVAEYWPWLLSAVLLVVGTLGLLLKYASYSLRLETGLRRRAWARLRQILGFLMIAGLLVVTLSASRSRALQTGIGQGEEIELAIDSRFKEVKMGEVVKFNTAVINRGLQESTPLIVALNVVNLKEGGEAVDLEEWSPVRTQYIGSLKADETIDLHWIITTGLHGDYLVYVVVIPQPSSVEVTTYPVANSSLYLTVTPIARLQPAVVLPFALGVPTFLLAITLVVYRRRRQQIDTGDPL